MVWAEVTRRAYEESELNWTYLSFITMATLLASIAIIENSQILTVGAMVLGPEFVAIAVDWINTHHNAVIGNGPYYLQTFNPTGGVVILNAFRDNTYPFKTGAYSDFKNPPELRIDTINVPDS